MRKVVITFFLLLYVFLGIGIYINYFGMFEHAIQDNKSFFKLEFASTSKAESIAKLAEITQYFHSDILYMEENYESGKKIWSCYKTSYDPNFIRLPDGQNCFFQNKDDFISSMESNLSGQRLQSVPEREEYVFYDWSRLTDCKGQGMFYVNSSFIFDPIDGREFLKLLKDNSIEIGLVSSGANSSLLDDLMGSMEYKSMFAVIFASQAICLAFYYLRQRKKSALQSLHGYGNGAVFLSVNHGLLIPLVSIFLGSVIGLTGLLKIVLRIPLSVGLGEVVPLFLVLTLAIALGMFLLSGLLLDFNFSDYIKGKGHEKGTYILGYISRMALLVASILFLSVLLHQGSSVITSYLQMRQLSDRIQDYYTFEMYDDLESSTQDRNSIKQFYDDLCQKFEPTIIISQNYLPHGSASGSSTPLAYSVPGKNYLLVSPNYLNWNPVRDPSGRIIPSQDISPDHITLLLPANYSPEHPNVQALLNDLEFQSRLTEKGITPEDIEFRSYSLDTEIYVYSPYADSGAVDARLKDVILVVDSIDSIMSYYKEPFTVLMSNSWMYFKIDKLGFQESSQELLDNYGLGAKLGMMPLTDLYNSNFQSMGGQIALFVALFLFVFSLLIVMMVNEVKLFFALYRQKIAVARSMGYGFFDIYFKTLIIRLVFWSIIFFIGPLLFASGVLASQFWLAAGFLALMEFLLFYWFSRRQEQRCLAQVLKGDWEQR